MERAALCSFLIILLVGLVFTLPFSRAHTSEHDHEDLNKHASEACHAPENDKQAAETCQVPEYDHEYWNKQAAEAWNHTLETYEPHPGKIVNHLNSHANRVLDELNQENLLTNGTRRQLKRRHYDGPCIATNPIDSCWRCNPNWAEKRFRLADCGLGFGYKAKGGKNGQFYVVTDPSDSDLVNPKPGTLRHAVIQKGPVWITFAKDMYIRLTQELMLESNKTIDARGATVYICYGAGLSIHYRRNIIIHGLRLHNIVRGNGGIIRDSVDHFGLRTQSDGDGISIFGSQNIWIDHVSMTRCSDGLIDAIMGSTGITISNSHFTDHNEDEKMQITLAFNHFGKRLVQRMPRCRWGYVHIVNNDYTHWNMYAIGGSMHPTILSQGNRFVAPPNNSYALEVTKRVGAPQSVWEKWTWISQGDFFQGGAYFVQSGDREFTKKHQELYDKVSPADAKHVADMTRFAGVISCKVGEAC